MEEIYDALPSIIQKMKEYKILDTEASERLHIKKKTLYQMLDEVINEQLILENEVSSINDVITQLTDEYDISGTLKKQLGQLEDYPSSCLTILFHILKQTLGKKVPEPVVFGHLDENKEYQINLEWEYELNSKIEDWITVVILEKHIDILLPSNSKISSDEFILEHRNTHVQLIVDKILEFSKNNKLISETNTNTDLANRDMDNTDLDIVDLFDRLMKKVVDMKLSFTDR